MLRRLSNSLNRQSIRHGMKVAEELQLNMAILKSPERQPAELTAVSEIG